jgi:hypothetical protein
MNAANKDKIRKYTKYKWKNISKREILTRSEAGHKEILAYRSSHGVCNGVVFPSHHDQTIFDRRPEKP